MKILITLACLLSLSAHSEFFKKDDFQLALGAQANSINYKRGMITYEGYQVNPIVAVTLWNPNLLFAGTALYYRHELNSNWLLRSRLNFNATVDDPLYTTDEEESERVRRERTTELDLYLEYHSDKGHMLRWQVSQDIVAHNGLYTELRGRFALYDFFKGDNGKALIQPGLFAALGAGNSSHNTYLYGQGARGTGVNNWEYGFYMVSPRVIDVFWPTLKVSRFALVSSQNRSASFVQETRGFAVEAIMAFRIW